MLIKTAASDSFSCNMENPRSIRNPLYSSDETDDEEGEEDGEGNLDYGTINMKDVRKALVYMIIVDELPFKHVEKPSFRQLMEVACPRFHIPSHTTIACDCLKLYFSEKPKLKEMLKGCQRICVTTNTWTSVQGINYMCLTTHFIDNDWKLNKKIINFCPISNYNGEAIGKVVEACLESWGIEDKLFTITFDNPSSNDLACIHLRRMVKRTRSIQGGKFLHMSSMAHTINLIVWDLIREHDVCIDRIRNAVKYVKNSSARMLRFKEIAKKANIESIPFLCFDVPTRWNTTYTMLDTALKFQHVFSEITLSNGENLKDNEKPPEFIDWKKVERLVVFLREFYLLARRISGSHYVTSDIGLFEMGSIYDKLNKWEKSADLEFQAMAISMKKKCENYWGDVEKMNMFIYVAAILNPISKFEVVELILTDMYGKEKGTKLANDVKEFSYTLFDEYRTLYTSYIPQSVQSGDTMSIDVDDDEIGAYEKSLRDRAKRLMGTNGYVRSEFERYLKEELGPEEEKMDALSWWDINGKRYPIVSRMARDILAMPLSTVASVSALSAGGHHLDRFRSSLTPKMVQALICTQDWIRPKGSSVVNVEENVKDLEEIEKDVGDDSDNEVVFVDSLI